MIMDKKRIIVALTGASGIHYAVDFLKALKENGIHVAENPADIGVTLKKALA